MSLDLKPMKSVPPSSAAVREAHQIACELCEIATGEKEARWSGYGTASPMHTPTDRLTAVAARLAVIATLLRDQWVPDDAEKPA